MKFNLKKEFRSIIIILCIGLFFTGCYYFRIPKEATEKWEKRNSIETEKLIETSSDFNELNIICQQFDIPKNSELLRKSIVNNQIKSVTKVITK